MTDMRQLKDIDLGKYFDEFISNLENPLRIWEHAFRKHISTASQHVLLLLSILPDGVTVKELEQIFQNFHTYRSTKYNLKTSPYDFQDALKELDGDFIQTVNQSSELVVKTQNPSVRDFLEQHLADTDSDVKDLISISDRFIQFRLLWNGRRGQLLNGLKSSTKTFIDRFENVINRDFEIVFDLASSEEGLVWDGAFSRFKLALEIYNNFPSPSSIQLVQSALEGFVKLIEVGEVSLEDVESATITVQSGKFPPSLSVNDLLQKSRDYFLDSVEDIYLFIYLANFVERFPDFIDDDYKERVEKKLNKKINHLASNLVKLPQLVQFRLQFPG